MSKNASLLSTLLGLSMIVEARDPYTGGHLWRVSQFSKLLAMQAGLSQRDVALCEIGGFLHDLGKVGVPDAILNKPDRLTESEFSVIRTHPSVGGRLLVSHPLANLAMEAVVGHHERPDGKGYPHGLAGDVIPAVARIVSIADAFDAMTSTRAYRIGMPMEKAMNIIAGELGRQFDAQLGQHFLKLDRAMDIAHIVGHSEVGIPLHSCPSCNAPMVRKRAQRDGEYVYCRACGGESHVNKIGDSFTLDMTGQMGDASVLSPDSDTDLIANMVEEMAAIVL